jgi:nucleoside 2-deoxyribosyltransferase
MSGAISNALTAVPVAREFITSKPVHKVYLAGAISGLTYDNGQNWRNLATIELSKMGILGFSPLRAKEYLRQVGKIEQSYTDNPMSTDRGIMTRDRYDVMSADAILFYLLGAERVSVGTCIEFGWADMLRKPIVLVMEKEGNIHEHPMVREAAGFRVETLQQGLEVLNCILNPFHGNINE